MASAESLHDIKYHYDQLYRAMCDRVVDLTSALKRIEAESGEPHIKKIAADALHPRHLRDVSSDGRAAPS